MKKCPPGVICLENVTMFFIFITLLIVGYFIYFTFKNKNNNIREKIIINQRNTTGNEGNPGLGFLSFPSYPYNNLPTDVLLNPYSAPLKDERYLIPEMNFVPPGTIPINVSTNIGAVDTTYRQLGILTPLNGSNKDSILPLMGRPLFTSRQKFQYYTISNQHNNVKLPISVKGKSALNEYGVDELFTSDTVYIEGDNNVFKVTIYDNNTIKYLPSI